MADIREVSPNRPAVGGPYFFEEVGGSVTESCVCERGDVGQFFDKRSQSSLKEKKTVLILCHQKWLIQKERKRINHSCIEDAFFEHCLGVTKIPLISIVESTFLRLIYILPKNRHF